MSKKNFIITETWLKDTLTGKEYKWEGNNSHLIEMKKDGIEYTPNNKRFKPILKTIQK